MITPATPAHGFNLSHLTFNKWHLGMIKHNSKGCRYLIRSNHFTVSAAKGLFFLFFLLREQQTQGLAFVYNRTKQRLMERTWFRGTSHNSWEFFETESKIQSSIYFFSSVVDISWVTVHTAHTAWLLCFEWSSRQSSTFTVLGYCTSLSFFFFLLSTFPSTHLSLFFYLSKKVRDGGGRKTR